MKAGDLVTIYQDPITCKKEEGKAELIKCHISREHDQTEYWEVIFVDEDITYNRWINKEKH